MNESRRYCEMVNGLQPQSKGPIALLLKHGVEYAETAPAPWRGVPKGCYANAQYLVKRRKCWQYVEGYACHRIPLEHAWCLDADGKVVDPTWPEGEHYFGIPFDMELVRRIRRIPGGRSYSVLHTWWKWKDIYPQLLDYLENSNCSLTKDVAR